MVIGLLYLLVDIFAFDLVSGITVIKFFESNDFLLFRFCCYTSFSSYLNLWICLYIDGKAKKIRLYQKGVTLGNLLRMWHWLNVILMAEEFEKLVKGI